MKKFFQSCTVAICLTIGCFISAFAQTDNCGYPDNSNPPRSPVVFNENEVLRAFSPASGGSTSIGSGATIKVWYNDEHPLSLGIRAVNVKTAGGTTTTNYPVTATPGAPTCAINPQVGSTIQVGDQAGVDVAAGGGRPIYPALFITNITNNPFSRSGTWQMGGTPIPPHRVCGTWKAAVKNVDKTANPNKIDIVPDNDPAKNDWGGIPDAPPGGFASLTNQGYGAEIVWNVDDLGLAPGTYLFQFMVHDGDQNHDGGDVGEACTIVTVTQCTGVITASGTTTPNSVCNSGCIKECFESGTIPGIVNAQSSWTINQQAGTVTIRTTLAKTFVDNTYGTNAIGWPNGHTFSNLTGSDNLQIALLDGNGIVKMQFKEDYITSTNTVPSGFATLGVTGGEGQMNVGSASDVVGAKTSLSENFNTFGYVLTTNSPATNANYTPNPAQPNWIYDVWYEVTVKLTAFGAAGFGKPQFVSVHASPSKTGNNSEPVIDRGCCAYNCNGAINLTVNSGTAPFTFKWSNGATTEDITGLCPGSYTVTITDAAGCAKAQTFNVGQTAPNLTASTVSTDNSVCNTPCPTTGPQLCFKSPTNPNVTATSVWSINQQAGTITIRTTLAKTFVDNTYGTNAVNWPGGHTFSNLTGSDNLQLALYDANGAQKMLFKMDYITATNTVPSGYATLGVTGGEGQVSVGSAADVTNVKTSISENFNTFNYILPTNSPSTDANYTPNPGYPNWIYDVWYEATVKLSAFGAAGFGYPDIASVHASPSKTGNNSEPVDTVHCTPPCVPTCSGTINLTVTTGTGPFSFKWSNGATTEDVSGLCEGIYTATVTDGGGCSIIVKDTIGSANCNDNNNCTTDACVNGQCTHTPIVCDDANGCTTEVCVNGECVTSPIPCDDANPCTIDLCQNGNCQYTAITCNDHDACTTDLCSGGQCVFTPINCNDFNECTADLCVSGVCTHTPVACPDTDPCTIDFCLNGECIHPLKNCGDNNTCTIDECVGGECFHTPVACNDNDGCTTDLCVSGSCTYTPVVCTPDANPCTNDFCAGGICKHPLIDCSDNNSCTIDECVNGSCVHTPVACNDNDACTIDLCTNGACHSTPVVCTPDTDPCTNDFCLGGICKHPAISCDDQNPCTTDFCVNGVCQHTGTTCNDQSLCTTDNCVNGTCIYTPITCNDNNSCTTDQCIPATGCVYTPVPCNDNSNCTTDQCVNGGCVYTPIVINLTTTSTNTTCGCASTAPGQLCVLDFAGLEHGRVLAHQYDAFGIHVDAIAYNPGGIDTVIIFNSNISGSSDPDLEAHIGNLAIIPQGFTGGYDGIVDEPNDNSNGGIFILTFDSPRTLNSFQAVDVDHFDGNAHAIAYGPGNVVLKDVAIPILGDGSVQTVLLNQAGVTRLEINAHNSIGVTNFIFDCSGPCCNGTATASATGLTGPFTYHWSNGQNGATIDSLCPGPYCVTATDAHGCTKVSCVTVGQDSCNNPCDGIVCNDQNPCTNDICMDGECVPTERICEDENECTVDFCQGGECIFFPILGCGNPCANSNLAANVTGQNPTACNACDGSASSAPTGGQPPYHYLWSTGDTTATVQGNPVPPFNGTHLCINAGGPARTYQGDNFIADQYSSGQFGTATYSSFNQTYTLDTLFRTERNAVPNASGNGSMTYSVPVINGTYDIDLFFAEIYYGVPGGNNTLPPHTGKRQFNVSIEGVQVLSNFDIVAQAGGSGIGIKRTFTVTVADGFATILFTNIPGKNRAKVSALCVKPHQEVGTPGLCPGTYSVTVTDGNGCTAGGQVTLLPPSCIDTNPCTIDACNDGVCTHTPVACDDQNPCTIDNCSNGQCVYTPVTCDDFDECTTDACVNGSCEYTQILGCGRIPCTNNIPCNDNIACTSDICVGGFCTNDPIVCNDLNPCTTDLCVNGFCQFTPVVCNDFNLCTTDQCVAGQCTTTPISCNDNNNCTTEICAPATGCVYTAVTCNDQNPCTTDQCNPASGCVSTPVVCNDNNACTSDACSGGTCVYTPIPGCGNPCAAGFCDDQNPCTVDVRDGAGNCSHTPAVNGNNPNYLRIINTANGASYTLKILYGPTAAWLNQNVIAGGNTSLCITMRDVTPLPGSMSKVHIRLRGSSTNEVSRITNNYPLGCVPREWTKVCIPLSAFSPADLTSVPYVEIFNSASAPYEIQILKIEFTGGATPFLWFGDNHTNNYVSVSNAAFFSQLVTGGPCNAAPKMSGEELNTVAQFSTDMSGLTAYPNPFENQLVVEFTSGFEGTAELRMVDVLGQVVKVEKAGVIIGANKQTLNLDNTLASGVYFLEVRMNNQVHYVKLMK